MSDSYKERQRGRREELQQCISKLEKVKLRQDLTKSTQEQADLAIQKAQRCISFLDEELR